MIYEVLGGWRKGSPKCIANANRTMPKSLRSTGVIASPEGDADGRGDHGDLKLVGTARLVLEILLGETSHVLASLVGSGY